MLHVAEKGLLSVDNHEYVNKGDMEPYTDLKEKNMNESCWM